MNKPFCRDGRLMIANPEMNDPLREDDIGPCEDCDCKRECDVCGEMKDDVSTFFYPTVGDTSACAKCRGEQEAYNSQFGVGA
jgi:hypothetical protein